MTAVVILVVVCAVLYLGFLLWVGPRLHVMACRKKKPASHPELDNKPIAIDVNNPPSIKTYNGPNGPRVHYCSCHHEPLQKGQQVAWWPLPESDAVLVFCEDYIQELKDKLPL